ncbi:MAG: catalase [Ferruginibacter sp.]
MPTKKSNAPERNEEVPGYDNIKVADLAKDTENPTGEFMTTNQGVRINDDQNSLKAGDRGPSLLEDFILREKITHFDHERIPERVVHARGSAAHGFFKVYESMSKYTKAGFLHDPSVETPVFARFSTVAGSRGSTDMARDVRGFAVKFYTQEGNFDLVGNNIPVFFIQDAIKFPDLVHAVKPEPHNEIPQAASAHDTFWDFVSQNTEATHMIMWLMSDRSLPRSYRMMEGFGVHTFRFINDAGISSFVKFHWKPVQGVFSICWDESQNISGKDPDFHRRDLWEAIENGAFPEWELGVQIVPEEDEHKFDFDLLDPTKLIPEELVPVIKIGKMTLNRNPDNFFAETEQVAFHIGHVVPGIDFTNDPLLQGRLFSYTDTQLLRLGGPNFHEIPINRPVIPVHNNQRDGLQRHQINKGQTSYNPNSLSGGCPFQAGAAKGGFTSFPERIEAKKVRNRSASFFDFFSQATLFFNSQSEPEKNHIVDALRFELGKVDTVAIRQRMLGILTYVDKGLAAQVAYGLGLKIPGDLGLINYGIPADADPEQYQPILVKGSLAKSAPLSMADNVAPNIKTRKIAVLAADGVDSNSLNKIKEALLSEEAVVEIIAPRLGTITAEDDTMIHVDRSLLTTASVLYDAVYVPGGTNSVATLEADPDAIHFINEAFKHCKPIAADISAIQTLQATYFSKKLPEDNSDNTVTREGIIIGNDAGRLASQFIEAIRLHRFWEREKQRKIPA